MAGTLQIAEDDNLGDASGDLVFAGGVAGDGAGRNTARRRDDGSTDYFGVDRRRGCRREDGTGDVVLEWFSIISGSGGLVKMGEAGGSGRCGKYVRRRNFGAAGMLTVTGAGALGSGDVVVTGAGSQLSVRGVAVGSAPSRWRTKARLSLHAGADAAETVVRIGKTPSLTCRRRLVQGCGSLPAVGSVSAGRVVIGDRDHRRHWAA